MRAGLAIKAEEFLRAGEGNEQSGTGQTITGTGSAGKQRTQETGLQNKTGSTQDVTVLHTTSL